MKGKLFFMVTLLAVVLSACQTQPENGEELIAKIHKKWEGTMPDHMTIDQRTVFYRADGTVGEEQIWNLAISNPDRMHIRVNGFESGNGMLFKNDSAFYFQHGRHFASDPKVHYLLILSYSIFVQEPSVTIALLRKDSFDLDIVEQTTLDGKEVYLVGETNEENGQPTYFVIDKEELVILKTVHHRDGKVFEVNFNNYQDVKGAYMATELRFSQKGVKTLTEFYENIQFPESLDEKLFSTETFLQSKW